jgi:hypothetical protein
VLPPQHEVVQQQADLLIEAVAQPLSLIHGQEVVVLDAKGAGQLSPSPPNVESPRHIVLGTISIEDMRAEPIASNSCDVVLDFPLETLSNNVRFQLYNMSYIIQMWHLTLRPISGSKDI